MSSFENEGFVEVAATSPVGMFVLFSRLAKLQKESRPQSKLFAQSRCSMLFTKTSDDNFAVVSCSQWCSQGEAVGVRGGSRRRRRSGVESLQRTSQNAPYVINVRGDTLNAHVIF